MDFFTTDLDGVTLMSPGAAERRGVLASVEEEGDTDYPEVYLSSGTGIVLGYRCGGILVWEEAGEVRRTIAGVDVDRAARAWTLLAEGDMEALQALPWKSVSDAGNPS